MILHDEVYVKKTMLFHGGTIFGKAVNNPAELANTVLGIMIVCLYGGPTFLSKMLPVKNLNSQFIHEQISLTREAIQSSNGKVKVIICDNNRTNQKFFKTYNTLPNKPWLTNDDMFLLFDFVYLLKSIQNNWLTEKMGLLEYEDNGISKIANWSNLVTLYKLESASLLKLSKLNEVAISPKPIEQQKVSICLRIFCEETHTALITGMEGEEGREDTAGFIKKSIDVLGNYEP